MIFIVAATFGVILWVDYSVIQKTIQDNLIETVEDNVDEIEFFKDVDSDETDHNADQYIAYENGDTLKLTMIFLIRSMVSQPLFIERLVNCFMVKILLQRKHQDLILQTVMTADRFMILSFILLIQSMIMKLTQMTEQSENVILIHSVFKLTIHQQK